MSVSLTNKAQIHWGHHQEAVSPLSEITAQVRVTSQITELMLTPWSPWSRIAPSEKMRTVHDIDVMQMKATSCYPD